MQEGPQTEVSGSSVKVAFSASLALRVYLILEAVSNPGGKGFEYQGKGPAGGQVAVALQ